MAFGRIWSQFVKYLEKDKLNDFHASKFKVIASDEILLRLIFSIWTSGNLFVFFARPNPSDYKCSAIYPFVGYK